MEFHMIHGENIILSEDKKTATRSESFCNAICFGARPVVINERISIKICGADHDSWTGCLRFGYTTHNPDSDKMIGLPKYACPDLRNRNGFRIKSLFKNDAKDGNIVYFQITNAGKVIYGVNRTACGIFMEDINVAEQMWPLFDIYGLTESIEIVEASIQPEGLSSCEYADACERYLSTLHLSRDFFQSKYDMCYCESCHNSRGDKRYYTRGEPPKDYGIPEGWFRFGLSVPAKAKANQAFEKWHRAYHGTTQDALAKILKVGDLVSPGVSVLGGDRVTIREGHFKENYKPSTWQNEDLYQVFLSPSMRYSGLDAYAKPSRFMDSITNKKFIAQVGFQVLISPDSYNIGPETVGAGKRQLDPGLNNKELEWSTNQFGATVLYGLLVKLT